MRGPEPAHSREVAERFGEAVAEGESDVLHRVVGVHVEIAPGLHAQSDPGMAGESLEHVVEKPEPGVDLGAGRIRIEFEFDPHPGLAGGAQPDRAARAHATGLAETAAPASSAGATGIASDSVSASRNAAFSWGGPTVTLSVPASFG